jgi:hypothetical protein
MPIFSWKNLFFSTLLIGISAGTLYAFGAYDNVFRTARRFPLATGLMSKLAT